MNPELKQKWVTALRSGDYKQGQGKLRYRLEHQEEDRFCCLGVLCDVAGVEWESVNLRAYGGEREIEYRVDNPEGGFSSITSLPIAISDLAEFELGTQDSLILLNDTEGKDFEFIADWIEENL
jgi:hypothetical protein